MFLSGAADSISFGITKSWDYLVAPSCLEFRTFGSFEELVADYESGNLHPADVKAALSKALNKILQVLYFFFDVHSTAYILSISCFLLLFSVPLSFVLDFVPFSQLYSCYVNFLLSLVL